MSLNQGMIQFSDERVLLIEPGLIIREPSIGRQAASRDVRRARPAFTVTANDLEELRHSWCSAVHFSSMSLEVVGGVTPLYKFT